MAASKLRLGRFKSVPKLIINRTYERTQTLFFCSNKSPENESLEKIGGTEKQSESKEKVESSTEPELTGPTVKFSIENLDLSSDHSEKHPGSFAEFFQKQNELRVQMYNPPKPTDPPREEEKFPTLLRNSSFIDLGDPVGKRVVGTIYHVVENDLYIDFGWKFPTVCRKPRKNSESYIRGAKVILLINDLEVSSRFLGSTTDITLLEADCTLLGLKK